MCECKNTSNGNEVKFEELDNDMKSTYKSYKTSISTMYFGDATRVE